MKIVVATIKVWNIKNANIFKHNYGDKHEIFICTSKDDLIVENMQEFKPDYIFFPHWSYLIPDEIVQNFKCVIFHMTDLPYGRGGSPLQNLIARGHKTTKISAIKATSQLDAGPIYMKKELSLEGTAQEIFERCSEIVFEEMIPEFLQREIEPVEQLGEPTIFKRRKQEDGMITGDMELSQIYDYIRMLDAEGYPLAYMDMGEYRLSFSSARLSVDRQEIEAKVVFRKNS